MMQSLIRKENKPRKGANLVLDIKHKYQKNNNQKWEFFIAWESFFMESAKILTTNLARRMVKTIKFHVFTHSKKYSVTILDFTSSLSNFLRDLT